MIRSFLTLACATLLFFSPLASARDAAENNSHRAALQTITVDELRDHVGVLADDSLEGREAGSRGGYAAAGYLVDFFKKYGLTGDGDNGGYFQSFGNGYRNILGFLEGRDPELRNEIIVVGAHYDHVGYGSRRNSYGPIGYIHNGADDNASGTAGVLETIEAISKLAERPRRSILFILFDGEEKGLLGSKHWVSNPTRDLSSVRLMINCDMIGRLRNETVKVFGTRSAQGLRRLVSENNSDASLLVDFTWELKENSDHHPFFASEIPILMLHTGLHDDYHRPRDDAHKINADGMRRVAQLLFNITHDLSERDAISDYRAAAGEETPAENKALEQPMPPRPSRLGIAWDRSDRENGLVVSRLDYDSPAQRGGLQYGDRIVACNGSKVEGGGQFLATIQSSPGIVSLVVQRNGEENPVSLDVQLAGQPVRVGISWREDPAEPGSLVVTRVVPGTPAERVGVSLGDRVYAIDGRSFANGLDFIGLVGRASGSTTLLLERKGKFRTATLDLPAASQETAAE